MTRIPDELGHIWMSLANHGGGDELICERCGIRQSQTNPENKCDPRPIPQHSKVKSDYDPFG